MDYPRFIEIVAQGGQICDDCGEFVPIDSVHNCTGVWSSRAVEDPVLPGSYKAWKRIAAGLEQIRSILDQKSGEPDQSPWPGEGQANH